MTAVGFTGTSKGHGMNVLQERAFGQLLVDLGATELHHGDCIGADAQAHAIAKALGLKTIGHPPTNPAKRAFTDCDEWREPAPYLDRNHNIVDSTTVLAATPQKMVEELRSGTWATVRYARHLRGDIHILWNNGAVSTELGDARV